MQLDKKKNIKKKYPQIEVIVLDKSGYSDFGYSDIKNAIRQKEKQKELIYKESITVDNEDYDVSDWIEYSWSKWSYKEDKMIWFDEIGEIIEISDSDCDVKVS